jgi:hypothetical protein
LEERQKHILQRAEEQRPLTPFVEAMFNYSQTLAEAELIWIRNLIKEVETGNV